MGTAPEPLPPATPPPPSGAWIAARSAAWLAVAYLAAGCVGVFALRPATGPAVFWPAAGVALGWLVRFGPRAWPGVFAAAVAVHMLDGQSPAAGVVLGAAAAAGAVLGAWLIRYSCGPVFALGNIRSVTAVAVRGAALGSLPVAVAGPLVLWWGGAVPADGLSAAVVWWLGDAAGVVLVAPLLLARFSAPPRRVTTEQVLTVVGMAVLVVLGVVIASSPTRRFPATGPSLALVAWAAVRFGPRGVAVANLGGAAVIGVLAIHGGGATNPQSLTGFAIIVAVTSLYLAAAIAERDADLAALVRAEAELARRERLLQAVSTAAAWVLNGPTTADTLGPVLALLGDAAGVSRAYVMAIQAGGGEPVAKLVHEWHADPTLRQAHDLAADPLPVRAAGFGRWFELLARGEAVHGLVRDMPANERPFLEGQSIRSLLVAPIAAGDLWGVVGFEDCAAERVWSAAEVDAVRAAAAALGGAIRRERTEAESRATQERLRALLEHSHDVTAVLSADGVFVFTSAAAERIGGYRPDELRGRGAFDLVHPDDLPIARLAFGDCLTHPTLPIRTEFRFRTAAGGWVWLEAIGTNLLDNPAVGGVVLNARDVTERREAERAVAQSEARFRTLFENAPVAIWEEDFTGVGEWFDDLRAAGVTDLAAHLAATPAAIMDAVSRIRVTDVNRACVELNGATDKDHLIANLGRLFTPAAKAAFIDELVALWGGARYVRLETRATKLSGGEVDIVLHLHVPEADGQVDLSQVVLIAFDVTEQRRLEEQFRQASKLEAVGRLAGGIAHDFNNLLTVINGFSEMLIHQSPAGSSACELAVQIHDAGERAAGLTRQLLAFSRRQVVPTTAVDLRAVVDGLGPLLAPLVGRKTHLVIEPGWALPPIQADHGQLEQAVMNLCVNAGDAMPGGGTLTVSTGYIDLSDGAADDVPAGRYVVLSVADTGEGIPEAVRPHLFDPFFTTKELGKGTGLGLSTVYGIVAHAGGHIRFDSTVGVGTTFRVYFPATALPPAPAPPEPAPEVALPSIAPGLVVLLVEDEPAVRQLSEAVLLDDGFQVLVAESGPAALALLAATPRAIDLLVTDLSMPGMTGRVLADRLRALYPNLRTVFVSGYTPEAIRTNPGEVFLPKPFGPDDLTRAIRGLLAGG